MSYEMTKRAIEFNGLTTATKSLLIVLAFRANDKNQCWPSYKSLMENTRMNKRTLIKSIKELEALGFISKSGEMKGKTKLIPVYTISIPETGAEVHLNKNKTSALLQETGALLQAKQVQKCTKEYKERIEKEYKSFFSDYLAYASQKRSDIRLGLTKDDVMEFWQWIEKNFKLAG